MSIMPVPPKACAAAAANPHHFSPVSAHTRGFDFSGGNINAASLHHGFSGAPHEGE
jgi:hypothetical protein